LAERIIIVPDQMSNYFGRVTSLMTVFKASRPLSRHGGIAQEQPRSGIPMNNHRD